MNRTALITGASSGLGKEFAKIHASKGDNLVLVARSKDKLESLKFDLEKQFGISVYVIVKDLSDQYAPKAVYEQLKIQKIKVDYLINNAGFGDFGLFAETNWEKQLEMINVNVTCLTYLTRLFLPDMILNKFGRILNVASTAAFQPGPMMAIYYASKAYVLSFSEALSEELQGTGVSVTALCPGPTATDFGRRAGFANEKIFGDILSMDSHSVALDGYKGLMNRKPLVVSGWKNWIGTNLVRFLPRPLPARLIKKVQQKRGS